MRQPPLLDELYDLIGNQGLDGVPDLLCRAVGARSCSLQVREPSGTPHHVSANYFAPEMSDHYVAHGIYLDDPWHEQGERIENRGLVINASHHVPDELFTRTRFYQDMIRPFGDDTGRCLGIVTELGDGQLLSLGLHKSIRAEFSATEQRRLEALVPHLKRVIRLQLRLESASNELTSIATIVRTMSRPALVVDERGRLVDANQEAEAQIRAAKGLSLVGGRLVANMPADQARLSQLIEQALRRQGSYGGVMKLSIADEADQRIQVTPLYRMERSYALITIDGHSLARTTRLDVFRLLYGLTEAEVEVAVGVADGLSIKEVAARREVSVATCKTLLQRVYQKTQLSKATQLARLIAGLHI